MGESTELEKGKRFEGEREGELGTKLDDTLLEMRNVQSELRQVREQVGVLVRRERCAETKTELATRRLNRMEKRDEGSEAECEATLEEALINQSKVVKVIVDKWFVDRGFGFGKTPTGEIVFIHASAVHGADVLKIGTDALVQVVNDDARAQQGYRARRAWGQDVWKAEKDKERANNVAQQERRAAALTAELAAQSEKKTAAVSTRDAPKMGAGGSHPQATMMPDPWSTSCRLSARANQAETSAPFETYNRVPADRGPFAPTRGFRCARLRSATRAPSTHQRGPNLMNAAKRTHRAGTASPSQEGRSMGTLPKAADSHAVDTRGVREEVQGKGTGRHLQQQQG